MFKKLNRAAERVATNLSRRKFLDYCGRGALALAGLLALPDEAAAAPLVCGPFSTPGCRGKRAGAPCNIGRRVGICSQAPNCTCRTTRRADRD
jgi:hypothetical protein